MGGRLNEKSMKQQLLVLFLSSFLLVSCTNTNPNNYKLQDTWGTDGNWGGKRATESATKPVKVIPTKVVEKVAIKNEVKPVQKANPVKKAEKINLDYSLKLPSGWSAQAGSTTQYQKEIAGQEIILSVGTLKNLSDADLDSRFKDGYVTKISEKMSDIEVLAKQDVKVKGKDGWSITYSFDKNGNKIFQTQLFVPHKNNIYLLSMASTAEGFVKGKEDFKSIAKAISFK
ncbi:MAG: hypothetical protein ACK4IX_07535 [Candidatus Sericytochromatia bacterium]